MLTCLESGDEGHDGGERMFLSLHLDQIVSHGFPPLGENQMQRLHP